MNQGTDFDDFVLKSLAFFGHVPYTFLLHNSQRMISRLIFIIRKALKDNMIIIILVCKRIN